MPAKVGAQLNCEMKVKSQTFNVNVTSVSGSDVKFDFKVDAHAEPAA